MNLIEIDQSVFSWLNSLLEKGIFFDDIVKVIAVYFIYLVPIGLLVAWFSVKKIQDKINLFSATIASVFMWQVPTKIIAWLWFRPRPIAELAGAKELVFHIPSYSFPSDHSTFLAALASYLYLLGYKTAGKLVFISALVVGIARVIAGIHFPLDVLAGWALGILGAYLLFKLNRYIEYLSRAMLWVARKIKLV